MLENISKEEKVQARHVTEEKHTSLTEHVEEILHLLGESPERKGLVRTPERVAHSLRFLTSGYEHELSDVIGEGIFESDSTSMVCQKDTEFFSMCEHHMLPFFGKVHIAYVPDGQIIGLSKLGRVINLYARRLQVQEQLTEQIAQAIQDVLKPKGVCVIISAHHFCMMMRGVQKQNAETITSSRLGVFKTEQSFNEMRELLSL